VIPSAVPDPDAPMTSEQLAWVKTQRVTEVDEDECKAPSARGKGICAYGGPDGEDACGAECIWRLAVPSEGAE
jgi:hypothetical protein